jgi:hypothetical protein
VKEGVRVANLLFLTIVCVGLIVMMHWGAVSGLRNNENLIVAAFVFLFGTPVFLVLAGCLALLKSLVERSKFRLVQRFAMALAGVQVVSMATYIWLLWRSA